MYVQKLQIKVLKKLYTYIVRIIIKYSYLAAMHKWKWRVVWKEYTKDWDSYS